MSSSDQVPPFGAAGLHPAPNRPPQIRPWHLQKLARVYVRQSSLEQVLHNTGSTAVQRDLAELPLQWGWSPSDIQVIDEDLGMSGTSASKRGGFQKLLDLVNQGQVGIVLVRDMSRLSRKSLDSLRFLDAASRAQILIYSNGRLFDLAAEDDTSTFTLELEGLLASRENLIRVRQLRAARVAKARQGHAVSRPPVGYAKGVLGTWVKDPDPEVQKIIGQLFQLALKLGSIGAVVQYMRKNNLRFPRRHRGVLTWGPPSRPRLHSVLTSPLYVGDYVYQRVRIIPGADGTSRRIEPRPEAEWTVSEGRHEAYVTKEDWRTITAALAARRPTVRPIVGKGGALLQGLLKCGQCHRWLRTQYSARDGQARGASYVCRPIDQEGKPRHSVSCPARLVDHAVVREVLGALTPAEIDDALTVIDNASFEQKAIKRSHERQLRQLEEEAEQAYRTFQKATESSRRVRVAAEQKYDQALERLETLKRDVARTVPPTPVSITPGDAVELRALTEKIQELWIEDAITNEDRKRLLRTVIAEIIVHSATREAVELEIVWAGGLRQGLKVLRPTGVDRIVTQLHHTGTDPKTIAEQLNAQGLTTGKGTPFTRSTVYAVLDRHGMRAKDERAQALLLIRQMLIENLDRTEMLARLATAAPRALGRWTPARLSQAIARLRRGVPGMSLLSEDLPRT